MPDVRPKIHRPTTNPIKFRLKSVLGVRSSYIERNNLRSLTCFKTFSLFTSKNLCVKGMTYL